MNALKATLAAVAFATLAVAPSVSHARDIAINQEGQMIIISPTGQGVIGTMKSMDPFKNAKPLSGGVVIFMHKGKVYMYDDTTGAMYDHRTDLGQF